VTLQEQVARELCRWDYGYDGAADDVWKHTVVQHDQYRREARKLIKMVCGSCGLAKPLASMEGRK
jgi:hypothetical protein